jgi:hypothetical protein
MKPLNILYWIIVLLCPIWIMISFALLGPSSAVMGGIYRIGINAGSPYYSYYVMFLGINSAYAGFDFGIIVVVFIIPSLIANLMLDRMEGGGAANSRIGQIIWISPVLLAVLSTIQMVLSVFGDFTLGLPSYLLVGLMHWKRLQKLKSA